MEIIHYFEDIEGENVWALVVNKNKYCYWRIRNEDLPSEFFEDLCSARKDIERRKQILLGAASMKMFDPAKLPYIKDEDEVLQNVWQECTDSENCMWFIDDPTKNEIAEGDDDWTAWNKLGISRDEYIQRMDAAIKKNRLEDVIEKNAEEGLLYTCYGDLASRFSDIYDKNLKLNDLMVVYGNIPGTNTSWAYFITSKETAMEAYDDYLKAAESAGINMDNMHPRRIVLRNEDKEDIDIIDM